MLAVAVHEQHRAAPRMVEAGEQRRLLAEIARQRHHLDIEPVAGRARAIASVSSLAAVVDVDHLAGERARVGAAGARPRPGVRAAARAPRLRCRAEPRSTGRRAPRAGAAVLSVPILVMALLQPFWPRSIAQTAYCVARRATRRKPCQSEARRSAANMICGADDDSHPALLLDTRTPRDRLAQSRGQR